MICAHKTSVPKRERFGDRKILAADEDEALVVLTIDECKVASYLVGVEEEDALEAEASAWELPDAEDSWNHLDIRDLLFDEADSFEVDGDEMALELGG